MILLFSFSCRENQGTLKSVQSTYELDSLSASDEFIDSLVFPYKIKLDSAMNRVIGYAPKTLNNHISRGETTLGNFVADLMLYQSNKKHNDSIDLALINTHGGLRVPINTGKITVSEIYELMPFDNEIFILNISGDLLLKVFNHTAQDCRNSISPSRFEIINNKAENILIKGEKIDPMKTYRLAISDYLANGGGGFDFLINVDRTSSEIKLRDMIINHIEELTQNNLPVVSQLEGRIIMHQNVQ